MTTKVKLILGIILLVLIGFIIFKTGILTYQERTFKQFNIETTNIVSNKTEEKYLDSIVHVGLNELNMDSIVVTIKPLTDEAKKRFEVYGNLKAHIFGRDRQYFIFLDDMGRDESIKVLSHELIHLKQYYTKKLILSKTEAIWDGTIYSEYQISELKYEDRPWEMEAFAKQRELQNKIEKVLY